MARLPLFQLSSHAYVSLCPVAKHASCAVALNAVALLAFLVSIAARCGFPCNFLRPIPPPGPELAHPRSPRERVEAMFAHHTPRLLEAKPDEGAACVDVLLKWFQANEESLLCDLAARLGGAGQALMHWRPKHLARWLTGSSPGLGLPAHVADAVLRLSIDGLALLKLESALLDAFRLASLESNMCGIEISQILAENLRKPPESVAFRYS